MPRRSIFEEVGNKDPRKGRIQGFVTRIGKKAFEAAREDLGALYFRVNGRKAAAVSDADTIEFLVRGLKASREYLEARRAHEANG